MERPQDAIIVALDVDYADIAERLVLALAPYVGAFKIGLELVTAIGAPAAIRLVHNAGGKVFYDGKFHDIPNTMAGAARAVARHGVKMFNFHASASVPGMKAAVAEKRESLALAVTVLTSMDAANCQQVYGVANPANKVIQFAHMAAEAGCDGIVCSPLELEAIKGSARLQHLVTVVPGIRPWVVEDDQKRKATPFAAVLAGADYLVIGRPITQPPPCVGSPVEAAKRIAVDIDAAYCARSRGR